MTGLPIHSAFSIVFAATLLLVGGLRAQAPVSSGVDSEVVGMRKAFESSVASTLEPLNRKYVAALRRLEKERAIAKDYEAAIALRDERLAVEGMLANIGTGTAVAATGTPDEDGTTGGDATTTLAERHFAGADATALNGAEKAVDAVRLTAAGQVAEWKVTGIAAGGYEVIVAYSCAAESVFQVKEHFFRLSCEAPASGDASTVKTETFGTLKVTSRASVLTLTVDSVSPDAPLVIHELKLVSNSD